MNYPLLNKSLVASVMSLLVSGKLCSQNQDARPNIIFFLTDDQRFDAAGYAGNKILHTPTMDSLARVGVQFRNCFASTPISAASRASLLTGMYERTHGYTFGTPPLSAEFANISYPKLLHDAGYFTGYFAKLGVNIADNAQKTWFDRIDGYESRNYWRKNQKDTTQRQYLSDYTTDQAIDFIRNAPSDKPFCLSIGFNAPHAEDKNKAQYIWAPDENALYADDNIPPYPLSEERYFEMLPEFVRTSESRTRWGWRFDNPEKYQRMVKGYYRMISGVDRAMGNILQEIRARGLEKNTIIVFMSDNGYFIGDRGLADKWLLYDVSLRVPLVVVDPRKPSTVKTCTQMALNIDIAPTILDYAGIKPPKSMQGKSLKPLVENKRVSWRKEFLCEHLMVTDIIPQSEGIRTEKWKYFRYRQHLVVEELYQLETDPQEFCDRGADPSCAGEIARLQAELFDWALHPRMHITTTNEKIAN